MTFGMEHPLDIWGFAFLSFCENDFVQLHLFDEKDAQKNRKLDAVIDTLRARFEPKTIIRGSFVNSGIKPMTGGVGEDEFPLMSSIL